MEFPHESLGIERANRTREREAVRVLGWLALGIGMFCWFAGGIFLIGIPYWFGDGHGDLGIVAFFGVAAAIGCALAVRARHAFGEPIFHARVAAMLNGLFLILALARAVLWL
jgi:hypothetical protein